jgi:hypothetical protein
MEQVGDSSIEPSVLRFKRIGTTQNIPQPPPGLGLIKTRNEKIYRDTRADAINLHVMHGNLLIGCQVLL